jgi:2,3-bisphosphoglycerate-dependent phosphoglycerate mutase
MKTFLVILFALIQFAILPSCITRYYITRHAERPEECFDCDKCELTPEGWARAYALKDTLIKKNIDTIFTSPCIRTKETAMPLAKALNKNTATYSNINTFIQDLKSFDSNTGILVVSHSDQIPQIVQALANQQLPDEALNYGHLIHILKVRCIRTHTIFKITTYGKKP